MGRTAPPSALRAATSPSKLGEDFASRSVLPELASGRGTARRSRVVEGEARAGTFHHMRQRRLEIAVDFSGRDAERADTRLCKPGVSHLIALRPISAIMRLSVDLDREPGVCAEEVEDIRPARMLTPELEAARPNRKMSPEQQFRKAHRASQASRARDPAGSWSRCAVPEHRAAPSTMLRMVLLPETSSGRIWSCR